MWGKIIIPMYRLWLNGLYGLYGPWCPLFSKRPINLISLSLSTAWSSWQHSRQPHFLHYWPFVWGIHVEWAGGFPTQRSKKACPCHYIIIVHPWWFWVTIISTHLTLFLYRSPCHIHPFDLVPMCHNRWAGNHRAAGRWSHPGWHGWDDGYKLTHKYMGICDLCRDRWASVGNGDGGSQWWLALGNNLCFWYK